MDPCFNDKKPLLNTCLGADAPAKSKDAFPIVGIGASAGGLAAFEAFFSGISSDVDFNMAFVIVQHLAPDHKSLLVELIQGFTHLPVFQVENGMLVKPNGVYINPPGFEMVLQDGVLHLLEPSQAHGHRLSIDFFFRSLAHDQRDYAICIILSGTGSDGSQGARAVKDEGGMVMVQSPDTADFNGMPHSVISTGIVDYELPPAEMPAQLQAYVDHDRHHVIRQAIKPSPESENLLTEICALIRTQTGHDFSYYKSNTISRRIARRMAIRQTRSISEYFNYLQETPPEVKALFQDFLIGVTGFFRDKQSFQILEEEVIPLLFQDKDVDAPVRVWCAGCSTGEEAYSIAILLQEYMDRTNDRREVQIFATDIDSQAIAIARAGSYPIGISNDITAARLAQFFVMDEDACDYRVQKIIRNMLVFSEQDVNRDPSFSKLDLVSCRNLLIYLKIDLQKKLFPMFYFTLRPGGFLFLGSAESVGEFSNLFSVVNQESKIYLRSEDQENDSRKLIGRIPQSATNISTISPKMPGSFVPEKSLLQGLTEQLILNQVALVAALVNGQGDILYLHGRSGTYLEIAPGEASVNNIIRMSRQGL